MGDNYTRLNQKKTYSLEEAIWLCTTSPSPLTVDQQILECDQLPSNEKECQDYSHNEVLKIEYGWQDNGDDEALQDIDLQNMEDMCTDALNLIDGVNDIMNNAAKPMLVTHKDIRNCSVKDDDESRSDDNDSSSSEHVNDTGIDFHLRDPDFVSELSDSDAEVETINDVPGLNSQIEVTNDVPDSTDNTVAYNINDNPGNSTTDNPNTTTTEVLVRTRKRKLNIHSWKRNVS